MKPEIEGLVNNIRDMVSDYLEQAYEMGYKDERKSIYNEQNNTIKVGDEVLFDLCGRTVTVLAVITRVGQYYYSGFNIPDGEMVSIHKDSKFKKTGNHYDTIAEILNSVDVITRPYRGD